MTWLCLFAVICYLLFESTSQFWPVRLRLCHCMLLSIRYGIDISTWRQHLRNLGSFVRLRRCSSFLCSLMRFNIAISATISACACLALAILLFTASVELNPGPVTCAELATMITMLTNTMNNCFQKCNDKLDTLVIDIAYLKAKCAVLEATVTQLTNDRVCLRRDLSDVRESAFIANIVSRKTNLILTGLPLSSLHPLDDFRTFMRDKLYLFADYTADATFSASEM